MRVAFIGFGGQARRHLWAFRQLEDVQIAGVASHNLARLSAQASQAGLRAYRDVDEVLRDPWVDAVVVATNTATHADLVLSALAAGKHVLCETPIALEAEDARRMERAASTSAGILQVALNRFDAGLRLLVDLVRSADLGLPINVATRRLSAWRADGLAKAHHGDVVEEFLAFDLDFLMWAFGPPIAVSAHADWCEGRADAVTALIDLPACTALCFATLRMPKGYPFTESAEVLFQRGRAELTTRFWPSRVERRLAITHLDGRVEILPSVGEDPALAQARHFVKVMSGCGTPAGTDAAAARALLEVTLGCGEAARTGRRTHYGHCILNKQEPFRMSATGHKQNRNCRHRSDHVLEPVSKLALTRFSGRQAINGLH